MSLIPPPLHREKSMAASAFWLTLAMALLLFLPFLLYDGGVFIYYGDYNVQQIPFYQQAHAAIRSGNIGWSWTTDLGANFVGSYSFYLLGSPFFWLTLPFPNTWVPYLMAPLMMLKMAFAGLTAYHYAVRFVRPHTAVMGAVLYAFSGFSIYNIFFNHFHEALIWFPLMLVGVERYMTEGKRGVFAVAVLMTALNNYYFFIAQAIFVMIYWVVRALSGDWEHRTRRFFGLWLEALLGTVGAAVLLLPSFLSVIQNGRTGMLLEGWGLLIYSTDQRPLDILHSFFFPPDLPARPAFFPDSNNKWSSMAAWIPLFGATGVIAYFQSRHHRDWLRRLLIILVLCAFVPALNAMFQLFNQMYYARWYYMLVLMMILATLRCFDEEKTINWSRAIGWSGGIIGAIALVVGLAPTSWDPTDKDFCIGLAAYPPRFWAYVAVAAVCLVATGLLVRLQRRDRRRFAITALAASIAVCLVGGWAYITMGKLNSNYPDDYIREKMLDGGDFDLPQDSFCRTDMYEAMDNQGMFWDMPCIQAFHSVVPGSVMDFYSAVGVERSVASRPKSDSYPLRSLLSTRWLFDYTQPRGDVQLYKKDSAFEELGVTAMPGWSYHSTQDGFAIYENENYIPMGFTYEHYITRATFDTLTDSQKQLVLLAALVLEEETDPGTLTPLSLDEMAFTYEEFSTNCAARRVNAADSFAVDKDGFTATVTMAKDNLVFFSVPYESGWRATVDGQPVAIERTNVGFMAVACPAGQAVTIRFDYTTPGLRTGALLSAAALLGLGLYLLLSRRPKSPVSPAASVSPLSQRPQTGFDLYSIYRPHQNKKESP